MCHATFVMSVSDSPVIMTEGLPLAQDTCKGYSQAPEESGEAGVKAIERAELWGKCQWRIRKKVVMPMGCFVLVIVIINLIGIQSVSLSLL